MSALEDLVKVASARQAEAQRESYEDPAITARKLIDVLAEVGNPHIFKVGDLVMHRPYSPYRLPFPGKPGIIVAVLDEPMLDPQEDSSRFDFGIELDVVVGCFSGGQFVMFHQPSMYLEPYTGEVA